MDSNQMIVDQQNDNNQIPPGPRVDDLTILQNNLLAYMDLMTSSIRSISLKTGPLRNDQASEDDLSLSQLEQDRRSHQGIMIEDLNQDQTMKEVQIQSQNVMMSYKQLMTQIQSLDNDYNKDEMVLMDELKELQQKNHESLKKYKQVKESTQAAQQTLDDILRPYRQF